MLLDNPRREKIPRMDLLTPGPTEEKEDLEVREDSQEMQGHPETQAPAVTEAHLARQVRPAHQDLQAIQDRPDHPALRAPATPRRAEERRMQEDPRDEKVPISRRKSVLLTSPNLTALLRRSTHG